MKTFTRLLKNFILLSIPMVLVSIYTFVNPMGYMSVEYAMWAEERDALKSDVSAVDTLIIGDSRAKSSVIPAEISGEGDVYNIAVGGATSIEMYYAVREYLKNHAAPERAFVIFAPYHFCDIDNWQQTQYYNYLSLPELAETECNAVKYAEYRISYRGALADALSFRLRLPNKYMDALISARGNGNLQENRAKYESVREEAGYTAFGEDEYNDELNYEAHKTEFDLSPMVDSYYRKMLDLLYSSGVEVIIEQAPVNRASDKETDENFYQGYASYMNDIEKSYPGTVVVKDVPVYDNSCFGDNNHMNRRGAEKYSRELAAKYY
ncbi:MAG: hypothetical protein K5668_00135 [Lachnospiraceae bacterium]|nr:hypothetical protein [Lachnospiraceae bacterium]